MSNALFFSLAAIGAAVLVALALVTPQGLGARSPAPFGHAVAARRTAPGDVAGPPPAAPPPTAPPPTAPTRLRGGR